MSTKDKLENLIMEGDPANIPFRLVRKYLVDVCGMTERIRGDHFIYTASSFDGIINIQPVKNMGKPYQIKQIRRLIKEGIL